MIFPTYGSVFACILLSSIFMIIICLLSNKINFILKNSANLLVTFMIMIMFRMFFHAILHLQKIFIQHIH